MGGEGLVSVGMSLVINTVFDLNESPVFKQVPGGLREGPNRRKVVARVVAWKAAQAGSERLPRG
jgi:hypothetical protein